MKKSTRLARERNDLDQIERRRKRRWWKKKRVDHET